MLVAFVMLVAPLQLVPFLRDRWPTVHRASGYLLFTAGGGLVHIAVRGTLGGVLMDISFSLVLAYMALV